MATNSISSVTSAPPQAVQPRQTQQPQQAELLKAADDDSKAKQAQAQQAPQAALLRPVTNENGQSTGNVINTTA